MHKQSKELIYHSYGLAGVQPFPGKEGDIFITVSIQGLFGPDHLG